MNSTKEIGLKLVRDSGLKPSVLADADYAAAYNDRRSVSGVAVTLGDTAIGWKSLRRNVLRLPHVKPSTLLCVMHPTRRSL